MDQKYFDQVKKGFIGALQSSNGTGYSVFAKATYNPAGKTGTAQEYARDEEGKYMRDSNGELIEVHNRYAYCLCPSR